ncbi:hypothetical protein BDY21DRAFT_339712, partial [Lineolata rhizophorae]
MWVTPPFLRLASGCHPLGWSPCPSFPALLRLIMSARCVRHFCISFLNTIVIFHLPPSAGVLQNKAVGLGATARSITATCVWVFEAVREAAAQATHLLSHTAHDKVWCILCFQLLATPDSMQLRRDHRWGGMDPDVGGICDSFLPKGSLSAPKH